jgi:hypothetical protein
MNITISGYNRPAYLDQTCHAVSRCVGVSSCRVAVLLDPCDETDESKAIAAKHGYEAIVLTQHAGCNDAIYTSLRYGFEIMQSEFHLHFEDDTVPTRDALLWFSWARDRYRHDPNVFTVSGYQQKSNGRLDECGTRRWFTPWGWGTWVDRWVEMANCWTSRDGTSWDIIVNNVIRRTRWEAYPTVSRIQNIGAERGTHVADAEWHAKYHHVPVTADDLDGHPVRDFIEVEPSL